VKNVEAKNLLKNLQSSYLRAALEVMKFTPIEALEVTLYSSPLDQLIICSVRLHTDLNVRANGGMPDLITQDLASSKSILSQKNRIEFIGNSSWSKSLRL